MTSTDPPLSTDQRTELVFALVGGAGVRLDDLSRELKEELALFGYLAVDIRLSDLLVHFTGWTTEPSGLSEFDRIRHRQEMGNAFRCQLKKLSQKGDALARAGIAAIRAERAKRSGDQDKPRAYILHQLKHPDEVDLLRQVYGPSFLLIAGHAPRDNRMK
jgi:cytidine deaminase